MASEDKAAAVEKGDCSLSPHSCTDKWEAISNAHTHPYHPHTNTHPYTYILSHVFLGNVSYISGEVMALYSFTHTHTLALSLLGTHSISLSFL